MRIFAFHLLNDFSGSPKVLRQTIKDWVKEGREVHLFTAGGKEGFLTGISGIQNQSFWYRWHANSFIRLLTYTMSQIFLFVLAFRAIRRKDLVYVNTVLPFGAALAGRLKGCTIHYHLHETTVNPPALKWFLFGMVKWTADEVICVSAYMAETLKLGKTKVRIKYNALEDSFLEKVIIKETPSSPENVLMICSLKWYKGIFEFVELAQVLSFFQFRLVLNATKNEIDQTFREHKLPENLTIYPTQKDVHPHYQWADLVVNLSRPDGWVETFGLTVIEAMAYQLPVIVPPVGGIAELVEDGKNGFKVDSRNGAALSRKVMEVLQNKALYQSLRVEASKGIACLFAVENV